MYRIECSHFNAKLIAESGQCFRWTHEDERQQEWTVKALGRELHLYDRGCKDDGVNVCDDIELDCTESEFNDIWHEYFDLGTDYTGIDGKAKVFHDRFLEDSLKDCRGMRILRQDRWETIISFLISQNNNIPRIKKSIEKICSGSSHFPTPQEILDMELSDKGLGYRDVYLKSAAQWELDGKSELMEINGVGPKVYACIRLYGMHDMSYCPIDTWMKKLIAEDYGGVRPAWMDDENAGYYQQLCFCHKRRMNKR